MKKDKVEECPIFGVHCLNYDYTQSTVERLVYTCVCGYSEEEYEDTPAGG